MVDTTADNLTISTVSYENDDDPHWGDWIATTDPTSIFIEQTEVPVEFEDIDEEWEDAPYEIEANPVNKLTTYEWPD